MNVKLIKGGKGTGRCRKETLFENVDSTLRQDFEDRIEVRLFYHPPRELKVITLPDDGEVIFLESTQTGRTTGKIAWEEEVEEETNLKLRVGRGVG